MKFNVEETIIKDVKIITPQPIEDDRGYFMEIFNKTNFESLGIPTLFLQANESRSMKNVVRGLHFQWDPPSGKLMRVTRGTAWLVAVDIRKNSPTLGKWVADYFTENNKKMFWAPPGFARGICTLSDITIINYMMTAQYNPKGESGFIWNDPDIGILWPIENPTLSNKDKNAQSFANWLENPNSNNFKI